MYLLALSKKPSLNPPMYVCFWVGIKYDFLSRYFAPWVGIPEDPVTGSAHTVLTPYWSTKFNGQKNFVARQCSKRGGDLSLTLNDNDNKVYISGHACVVVSGKLNIV